MIDPQLNYKKRVVIFLLIIIMIVPVLFLGYEYYSNWKVKQENLQKIGYFQFSYNDGVVESIVLNRDNTIAYVAVLRDGIYALDVTNPLKPKILATFKEFKTVSDIVLSPDENVLYVSGDGFVFSLDLSNKKRMLLLDRFYTLKNRAVYHSFKTMRLETHGILYSTIYKRDSIALSNDGKRLYVAGANGAYILDVEGKSLKELYHFSDKSYYAVAELDSKTLLLVSAGSYYVHSKGVLERVDISNILDPKVIETTSILHTLPYQIVFSNNRRRAYLGGGLEKSITVLAILKENSVHVVSEFKLKEYIYSLESSVDGKLLYVGNSKAFKIFDMSYLYAPKEVGMIKVDKKCDYICFSRLSHNKKDLYMGSIRGRMKIIHNFRYLKE